MGRKTRKPYDNPVIEWIDSRLPIFTVLRKEYCEFPTPKNLNYLWNFGAISMFMLITMIISGVFLAMHYTADTALAFDSVERITHDVNSGWLIHSIHKNGASFFFIAVYIHMFRGIYYGSYKRPRELLWILGVIIFLLMMATAFFGYVLPWGQGSFWSATVITNLFSAIPFIGDNIVAMLWGGTSIDNPMLTRFFALHFLLPFVICAVVFLHIWALHEAGSNNPLGIDTKGPQDSLPFSPYYVFKDIFGLLIFLIIFAVFVFYMPDILGRTDNNIPANPLVMPHHIAPEWYFLPFYAILRAVTFNMNIYMMGGVALLFAFMVEFVWRYKPKRIPALGGVALLIIGGVLTVFGLISDAYQGMGIPMSDAANAPISAKLGGVMAMFGGVMLLMALPWLDSHPVRSARFRPVFRMLVMAFTFSVFVLGYAGSQSADKVYISNTVFTFDNTMLAQLSTGFYFFFFLIALPLLSRFEKGKELPVSIHQAVLEKSKPKVGS